jgi:hypothetical protein
VESEVWALHFALLGEHQLDVLSQHVISTPSFFKYHPFCHINFKEQAYICKQAARQFTKQIQLCGTAFFMDFGFMRASANNYKCLNETMDKVVLSYGNNVLTSSLSTAPPTKYGVSSPSQKEPPLNILSPFMANFLKR